MMLQVRDLTKAFRGLVAVRDVSFDVAEREIVTCGLPLAKACGIWDGVRLLEYPA